MNSNKRTESNMYDVSTYSDNELYDILDLSEPTDRELEAKILFLHRKYKNMQNSSGDQLAKFFYDIYDHFFDNDNLFDQEVVENYEDNSVVEGLDNMNNSLDSRTFVKDSSFNNINDLIKVKGNSVVFNNTNDPKVTITKQVEYAADNINPLLQQTITKVISIDSQYRSDKNTLPTEFTFELSEPLKDVVSLSLYSVQIPYTWYTIAKSYGSNLFFLKGNSPGINNGNHDISFSISPGNYSPKELETAVNNSIKENYNLYTDVSFGSTNISYNSFTSLATLQMNIINNYSENSYRLYFPNFTTPNYYDASRNINDLARSQIPTGSIPSFLGLNDQYYNFDVVNTSASFTNSDINNNNFAQFQLDNSNNFITIIKYIPTTTNDQLDFYKSGVSLVDLSFNITLSSLLTDGTKYSRNQIVEEINNRLNNKTNKNINNKNVSEESNISLTTITDISNINYGYSYYQMKIKPSRYATNNTPNSKILILFPDETYLPTTQTKIWTGSNSCFRFTDLSNEVQFIKAETQIVKQTERYTILSDSNRTYINLTCINPLFIDDNYLNDISFSFVSTTSNNIYSIPQLISTINQGIIKATQNRPFLNGPNESSKTYDPNSGSLPSFTTAYIDTNYNFTLSINIEKYFTNSDYVLDFNDSYFNNTLGIDLIQTSFTGITSNIASFTQKTLEQNSVLFKINPTGINGNKNDNIGEIKYTGQTINFANLSYFSTYLTSYLINYIHIDGNKIFTKQTLFQVTQLNSTTFNVLLNLYVSRNISSKDYKIQFIDNINIPKFWGNPLNIDTRFVDLSQNLTLQHPAIFQFAQSDTIIIKGNTPITRFTINFSTATLQNKLNVISLIADDDGVYSTGGENNINLTIPILDSKGNIIQYTRDTLIAEINSLLSKDPRSYGSYLYLTEPDQYFNYYLQVRININKLYNATDYKLVFYDTISYVKCFVGAKGIQNTTWDSTLGWILGFRNSTNYNLLNYTLDVNMNVSITGDTAVSTNLFNYFLICLDDYNLNHLNDGLVTITDQDRTVSLPSYGDRSNFQCDPVTNTLTYNTDNPSNNDQYSKLTQNQIYALTQKANAKNATTSNIVNGQNFTNFGKGPFSQDVFAVIPMKLAGLQNGSYFVEYGGTLQNNNRFYFGPANIHRMTVKLISDKGNVVDLNGANWSFSFLCQQLYKKNKPVK